MRFRQLCLVPLFALLLAGELRADPIIAGQTSWVARAIQDVELFANTAINTTSTPIMIDDLSGIAVAGINRETQVGNTIEISSFFGWDFVGSLPGFGTYRFGAVGPFSGSDYTGQITNVMQDPSDPGFSSGDPSSFLSGDVEISGDSFAFEFLTGPLAGVVLTTDPSQNFSFQAQFDGLPPSVGTAFTNDGDEFLNVLYQGQVVGTSSDRRVIRIVPEPTAAGMMAVLLGTVVLVRRRAN